MRHADVVPVSEDEAVILRVTHPRWDEAATAVPPDPAARATAIHAGRLWIEGGELRLDREAGLLPPVPRLRP